MAKLIRFPEDMETWLTALSERERRTFTAQLLLIVDEWRALKAGTDEEWLKRALERVERRDP